MQIRIGVLKYFLVSLGILSFQFRKSLRIRKMIATKIGVVFAILAVLCCIKSSVQLDRKRMIVADIPGVGKVKGRRIETAWSGKNIFQFFDIKYAESPSGERRFKVNF